MFIVQNWDMTSMAMAQITRGKTGRSHRNTPASQHWQPGHSSKLDPLDVKFRATWGVARPPSLGLPFASICHVLDFQIGVWGLGL